MVFSAKTVLKFAVTAVALAMLPDLAMAQSSTPVYTLPVDDLSRRTFIDPLFGPISGAGTASPLTTVVMVFNTALLFVAGILMAYTVISGVMTTAHDGEMMGKKWSSMWIPIRTAIGVGAILPVVKGGWCVAQVIVIWLAMQGAAIANMTWLAFIGNGESLLAGATYAPPSNHVQLRTTIGEMLVNNVCVEAHRVEYKNTSGLVNGIMMAPLYDVYDKSESKAIKIYPGQTSGPRVSGRLERVKYEYGHPGNQDACGSVDMMDKISDKSAEQAATGKEIGLSGQLFNTDNVAVSVGIARRAAFKLIQRDSRILAQKIVGGTATQKIVNDEINKMISGYTKVTSDAAKASWSTALNKDMLTAMKADGWAMAGAFYMTMAKAQDTITAQIVKVPASTTAGRVDGLLDKAGNYIKTAAGGGHSDEVLASMQQTDVLLDAAKVETMGGVSSIGSDGDSDWSTKILSWFIGDNPVTFGEDTASMRDVNQNPIVMAQALGSKMVAWAWGSMTAVVAIAFASNVTTPGGWSVISGVMTAVFGAILVPGAILSTYLPLMPYILWIGAMLGWGILLVEAVIAAPLWAVAHIAPDADGVAGRGGQGYMLVLSLVIRPALMVIGLVAAMVLLKPIGYLINSTFVGAFALTDTGLSAGFVTRLIAGCIIYCVLMIMMVQRTFSLIHVIPDRLMRWIGSGGSNEIGEHAQAAGEGLTKATAAVGSMVAVSSAAQQGLQGAMSAKRAKADNDLQKSQNRKLEQMGSDGRISSKTSSAEQSSDRAHASGSASDHTLAANDWNSVARSTSQEAESARTAGDTARADDYDAQTDRARSKAKDHMDTAQNVPGAIGTSVPLAARQDAQNARPSAGVHDAATRKNLEDDFKRVNAISSGANPRPSDHARTAAAAEALAGNFAAQSKAYEKAGNAEGAKDMAKQARDMRRIANNERQAAGLDQVSGPLDAAPTHVESNSIDSGAQVDSENPVSGATRQSGVENVAGSLEGNPSNTAGEGVNSGSQLDSENNASSATQQAGFKDAADASDSGSSSDVFGATRERSVGDNARMPDQNDRGIDGSSSGAASSNGRPDPKPTLANNPQKKMSDNNFATPLDGRQPTDNNPPSKLSQNSASDGDQSVREVKGSPDKAPQSKTKTGQDFPSDKDSDRSIDKDPQG